MPSISSQNTVATSGIGERVIGTDARDGLGGPAPNLTEHRLGFCGRIARALALAGGFLLIGVVAMTGISVLGRYLFNAPIPGDYEITELACGVAIFAFFPYCQVSNANIVVKFFTGFMHPRYRTVLDTVHSLVFAAVAALIAWRLFVGGIHKFADGETTIFLGIPVWLGYFFALPGAVLLTVVSILIFYRYLRALR
ncbi:MAG: TRAP transporter small permease [Gammaproteobacteria bacterium]|nr:TRAP transporter small permease [Gammaproteobacteria bacterium]MYI89802.1 TRAP transporter small permease [Gammaproteobacteria bacterium]